MEGDRVDDANDLRNLFRGVFNAVHGFDSVARNATGHFRMISHLPDGSARLSRPRCRRYNVGGYFLQCGCSFLERSRLLLGAS
ncbi:hypothetical protein D3C87_1809980 [compost metagenome]